MFEETQKENDLFFTSTGESFYNFEGLDFFPDENKYCVSMPIGEEFLIKTYGENGINEAKNTYTNSMMEYAVMMCYKAAKCTRWC